MAMMRTRTKNQGMCLCLGIALALLLQPSTDFARGVPGLKDHVAKRHPLHAGVARRAGAAQEDDIAEAWGTRASSLNAGLLGSLLTCDRVSQHEAAVLSETVRPACFALVQAVLLQSNVPTSKFQDFFQLGLAFIERTRATVRAVCAMRVAIDMDGFPYDLPCNPEAAAEQFSRDRKSRVCLAKMTNQKGVDSIGFDGDTMTLIHSKYPESDGEQQVGQITKFMDFVKKTGVTWAKSAKCTRIRAIFATGKASIDYRLKTAMRLKAEGVDITYTIYAKTENSRNCAIPTQRIDAWIPPGLMCM
ncbi:unnamed protein product [Effrenium voratum]|uniref:Uncharacterized protein n=1 Tax=Effrenium voratum TaxID=2562239 RepID=A0AA36IUB4_9DINO|nr:unnamed protein product [Effrenium voratum]